MTDRFFAARRILITGGGSGIGRALAIGLSDLCADVIVCGRSMSRLQETAELAQGPITIVAADLSQRQGLEAIRAAVEDGGGRLDMLINNAGLQQELDFRPGADAQDLIAKTVEEITVNLTAPLCLTASLMDCLARPGGTVVNVTSILALHPKKSAPVYCASKAGLASFTRALRGQWERDGLRVVDVIPPLVDTQMTAGRGSGKISPEMAAQEIIQGLRKGRPRILIGKARFALVLNRFFPGLLAKAMMKS